MKNTMTDALDEFIIANNLQDFTEYFGSKVLTNVPCGAELAAVILAIGNVPNEVRELLLKGYARQIRADGECSGYDFQGGMGSCYSGYQMLLAYRIAKRWLAGDFRFEVGLKYADFDTKVFCKKFKFEFCGTFPAANDGKYIYDVYQSADGSVHTCETGRFGDGGYSSFVFSSPDVAFKFLDWFLLNPANYIKDLNIGYNGLGAFGIEEIELLKLKSAKVIDFPPTQKPATRKLKYAA